MRPTCRICCRLTKAFNRRADTSVQAAHFPSGVPPADAEPIKGVTSASNSSFLSLM